MACFKINARVFHPYVGIKDQDPCHDTLRRKGFRQGFVTRLRFFRAGVTTVFGGSITRTHVTRQVAMGNAQGVNRLTFATPTSNRNRDLILRHASTLRRITAMIMSITSRQVDRRRFRRREASDRTIRRQANRVKVQIASGRTIFLIGRAIVICVYGVCIANVRVRSFNLIFIPNLRANLANLFLNARCRFTILNGHAPAMRCTRQRAFIRRRHAFSSNLFRRAFECMNRFVLVVNGTWFHVPLRVLTIRQRNASNGLVSLILRHSSVNRRIIRATRRVNQAMRRRVFHAVIRVIGTRARAIFRRQRIRTYVGLTRNFPFRLVIARVAGLGAVNVTRVISKERVEMTMRNVRAIIAYPSGLYAGIRAICGTNVTRRAFAQRRPISANQKRDNPYSIRRARATFNVATREIANFFHRDSPSTMATAVVVDYNRVRNQVTRNDLPSFNRLATRTNIRIRGLITANIISLAMVALMNINLSTRAHYRIRFVASIPRIVMIRAYITRRLILASTLILRHVMVRPSIKLRLQNSAVPQTMVIFLRNVRTMDGAQDRIGPLCGLPLQRRVRPRAMLNRLTSKVIWRHLQIKSARRVRVQGIYHVIPSIVNRAMKRRRQELCRTRRDEQDVFVRAVVRRVANRVERIRVYDRDRILRRRSINVRANDRAIMVNNLRLATSRHMDRKGDVFNGIIATFRIRAMMLTSTNLVRVILPIIIIIRLIMHSVKNRIKIIIRRAFGLINRFVAATSPLRRFTNM